MDLDAQLEELTKKKNLKRCYEKFNITFPKSKEIDSEAAEQVKKELLDFAQKRILEISQGIELKDNTAENEIIFTEQEKLALKKMAQRLLTGINQNQQPQENVGVFGEEIPSRPAQAPTLIDTPMDQGGQNLINNLMSNQRIKRKALLNGDEVTVMADNRGQAIVKFPNGEKLKVPSSELQPIR